VGEKDKDKCILYPYPVGIAAWIHAEDLGLAVSAPRKFITSILKLWTAVFPIRMT